MLIFLVVCVVIVCFVAGILMGSSAETSLDANERINGFEVKVSKLTCIIDKLYTEQLKIKHRLDKLKEV